jgi:hypothetical protein
LELDAVEQLKDIVEQMRAWLLKVDEAKNTDSEDGSGSFTIEVLHALLQDAGTFPIELEEIARLRRMLVQAEQCRDLAHTNLDAKVHIATLRALVSDTKQMKLALNELQGLQAKLAAAEAWVDQLHKRIMRRNMAETAVEAFGLSLFAFAQAQAKSDGLLPEHLAQTCLCQSEKALWMVACDSCGTWYHGKCVNARKSTVDAGSPFDCPVCCCLKAQPYCFDLPAPKGNKLRIEHMNDLIADGSDLNVWIPELCMLEKGREIALDWQLRAKAALLHDADVNDMNELLSQHKVLIVTMPDMLHLHGRILLKNIRTVLPSSKACPKPNFETIDRLLMETKQFPGLCNSDEVRKLSTLRTMARAWMDMANQEMHLGKLTATDLQALLDKSRDIPVEMAQVNALEQTKILVDGWLKRAADDKPLAFSTLSALVRDGEAIKVVLPRLPELKRMLQQAEIWMDQAFAAFRLSRKSPHEGIIGAIESSAGMPGAGKRKRDGAEPSSNKPTVQAVQDLLAKAEENQVVLWDVAVLDGMLEETKSWCAEAAKFVGGFGGNDDCGIEDLSEAHTDESEAVFSIMSRGKNLRLHVDELFALQKIAWFHQKRRVASGLLTLDDVDALLDDAAYLHIPDECTLSLQDISASCGTWLAEHKAVLANIVTLEKLEELEQNADRIKTQIPEALQLKSKIASVKAWQQKAQSAIDETSHMNDLANLVNEASLLSVDMGDTLKAINEKIRSGQLFSERVRRKLKKSTLEACAEAVGVPPFAFTGSLAPPKDRISRASKKGKQQKAGESYCNCGQDKGGMLQIAVEASRRQCRQDAALNE